MVGEIRIPHRIAPEHGYGEEAKNKSESATLFARNHLVDVVRQITETKSGSVL